LARMGGDECLLLNETCCEEEVGARIIQFRDMVSAVGREICGEDVLDAASVSRSI